MLDLAAAAASDDLRSTVDYGLIARGSEVSTKERSTSWSGWRSAGADAAGRVSCEEVRVRVRKLTPRWKGQGIPGVELTRRRR
jgi:dihydroneopterin aldolase